MTISLDPAQVKIIVDKIDEVKKVMQDIVVEMKRANDKAGA